MIDVHDC